MIPTDDQLKKLKEEMARWVAKVADDRPSLRDSVAATLNLEDGSWRIFVALMAHLLLELEVVAPRRDVKGLSTEELMTEIGRRIATMERKQ
jgi:hypothetical protein